MNVFVLLNGVYKPTITPIGLNSGGQMNYSTNVDLYTPVYQFYFKNCSDFKNSKAIIPDTNANGYNTFTFPTSGSTKFIRVKIDDLVRNSTCGFEILKPRNTGLGLIPNVSVEVKGTCNYTEGNFYFATFLPDANRAIFVDYEKKYIYLNTTKAVFNSTNCYKSFKLFVNIENSNGCNACLIDNLPVYEPFEECCTEYEKNANQKTDLEYSLFPNPSNEFINVTNKEKISTIEIYDLTGKQIKVVPIEELNNNKGINIKEFKSGIYLMKIIDLNNQVTNQKFQKI
ncbi:T9SS type A sorting domain-containing protein [Flavobacterium urocaniciphilum]|uniref:Por secretion system C-terminal sorting domain-containing protein n=1 Tax=Flavobacterium urocaniciphilum TaxID=1299341 RepID=A0A1H8ZQM5_9FLAO|nr:T9SS type A sorting domain-containing protein [Flavobacterium urocaniciphilum]SEP66513.1 Por secretion system C-terminal sorting domain-containing protein [Flavobacterium urocaniciphilum]